MGMALGEGGGGVAEIFSAWKEKATGLGKVICRITERSMNARKKGSSFQGSSFWSVCHAPSPGRTVLGCKSRGPGGGP